jgi:hypothetical protein
MTDYILKRESKERVRNHESWRGRDEKHRKVGNNL